MDDRLREFLEKFAELERRVRRLAAEDRAEHRESEALRERLEKADKETARLQGLLEKERAARRAAKARVDELIARLSGLSDGAVPGVSGKAGPGDESGT